MSETKEVAGLVERLRSRATKLGGDEVQELVTVRGAELLHIATTLEAKDREIERLTADCQMKDELLTAAVDDYNQALATVSTLTAERDAARSAVAAAIQLGADAGRKQTERIVAAEATVSTLTRQLEEARGKALEDAAKWHDKQATKYLNKTRKDGGESDRWPDLTMWHSDSAAAIRSLKQGERE